MGNFDGNWSDVAPGDFAETADSVAKNDDGSPKLDFATYAEAEAQAKAIGGTVEAVGVAYKVNVE